MYSLDKTVPWRRLLQQYPQQLIIRKVKTKNIKIPQKSISKSKSVNTSTGQKLFFFKYYNYI